MRHRETEVHRSPVVARLYDPELSRPVRHHSGLMLTSMVFLLLYFSLLCILVLGAIVFSILRSLWP